MTISAKIVCDSISTQGVHITTLELCYPRFIHSEFMTHRMFSRNAASSRAIPIEKMLEQVQENPAIPIHWGKNQPGMQAREECNNLVSMDWDYYNDCDVKGSREAAWIEASNNARKKALAFSFSGYHKQIVNRLLEPFQYIKVIVTATEWDNFFKLRLHEDAQPEMMVLAEHIKEAMENSVPMELGIGEWHLPYVTIGYSDDGQTSENNETLEQCIKMSVARCARVSYLNHDNSNPDIEKDIALADKLLEAGHMSPFEHQATPMNLERYESSEFIAHANETQIYNGVTYLDRGGDFWSGNFKSWIQYRALLSTD